jgi:hypothetical protein
MGVNQNAGKGTAREIFAQLAGDQELVKELAVLAKADELRRWSRNPLALGLATVIPAGIGGTIFLMIAEAYYGQQGIFVKAFAVFGAGLGGAIGWIYAKWGYLRQAASVERRVGLRREAQELQESIQEDFVNKLIRINFKYIDIYYEQTREQANKSFLLSAAAAVVGLIIIGAGIWMLFTGTGDDKLTAGIVATATGAISEFIGAVFFYLYNQTVTKMSEYHKKLVITQNNSLALKVIDDLPSEPAIEARKVLIDRLTDGVNKMLVGEPI